MSGGALNYLFHRLTDSDEMNDAKFQLERVIIELEKLGLGESIAAEDVRSLIASFDVIKSIASKLSDVLRSVEWELSGDQGPEDVAEAVKAYGLDHDVSTIKGALEVVDDRFVFWMCPRPHTEQHVEWESIIGVGGPCMKPKCVVCGVEGPAHVLS